MRNRWRALVRDRSVMREAVAAELREADEDLKELGEGLSRGDLRAVAAFARHQPLLTSAVAAPLRAHVPLVTSRWRPNRPSRAASLVRCGTPPSPRLHK